MSEIAQVWNEQTVKARKKHTCVSGLYILPGQEHIRIDSLCDGDWSTVRLHPLYQQWVDKLNEDREWHDELSYYESWCEWELGLEDLISLQIVFAKCGMEASVVMIERLSHLIEAARFAQERENLTARINHAEHILDRLSCGYWQRALIDKDVGDNLAKSVRDYWELANNGKAKPL